MGWQRVIVVGGEETIAEGDIAITGVDAWDSFGRSSLTRQAAEEWLTRKKESHIAAGYELVEGVDSFFATKTKDGRTKERTILIRQV